MLTFTMDHEQHKMLRHKSFITFRGDNTVRVVRKGTTCTLVNKVDDTVSLVCLPDGEQVTAFNCTLRG